MLSALCLCCQAQHITARTHMSRPERDFKRLCSSYSVHDVRRPARKLAVRASPGEAAFIDYLPGLGNRPQVLPITAYINCKP